MHPRHVGHRLLAMFALCGLVTATAVFSAPVAGAATDANRNYVTALYSDLLDRSDTTTDAAGIEFWANRLGTQSRPQVVHSMQFGSNEYFGRLVDVDYLIYLDRLPDSQGRAYYVTARREGRLSYESFVATLVGSSEYYRLAGSTNGAFVDKAYADIFGTEPSDSARAYFVDVAVRLGRAAVARRLVTSQQAREAFVRFQYNSYLGRDVDADGLAFWVDRLSHGLTHESFDAALLSSQEYYNSNS